MNNFQKRLDKIGKKIMIPLLWWAIVILSILVLYIGYWMFTDKLEIKSILILSIASLFILYFIYILVVSVVKYKKETMMTDTERRNKWDSLSPEYQKFSKNMRIFSVLISIFLISFGLFIIFTDDCYINGALMLMIGFNILTTDWIMGKKK